ncbi:GAF domain-containing protein [Pseudochryseolinea flava]|uniref:GAF domain-containing protein n=1 Tax=Pseudochryseolinea flava TaxID=2059302 RepID=UPI00140361BD|nr:GAF domain-containing protein [Pseudochryseolinea flava]
MAVNEHARLVELLEYQILDTAPEKDLDDLIEIASALCETPMSLITFIDEKRQWFKAAKGIDGTETLREDSFCVHALNKPKEVLVVQDPLNDDRFKHNRYVVGHPNIRFYAGAPLETPSGNVLGTLCIIDDKPREISEIQKRGLQLLAKKAMDFLNARKTLYQQGEEIAANSARLKKLTDLAPGCIYQFEMNRSHECFVHFVSDGISRLSDKLTPEKVKYETKAFYNVVHVDDRVKLRQALQKSFEQLVDISIAFRVPVADGTMTWYWAKAIPERIPSGNVMWYGVLQDITDSKAYEEALEQISFDISHVLRRPVATMLGLTSVIEKEDLTREQMLEYVKYIKIVSGEMDNFTRRLNQIYYDKKQNWQAHHTQDH